ncbi:caspase family protein [Hahella aquimaris]|uniref:caspase family protein n=1 Tax=Hahella sp. HNIBRBA332 TaxID=3015983 RepID=UPI00273C06CA|nr:caspase family protein [Hahella sp. HNIBRBA332]WLQ16660.1 caspase family protein [Hahella sp. HNIBRBA332]
MTQVRLREISEAPGTHALIIGVGNYKYLRGGPEEYDSAVHMGLSVLRSPPISAMEIAHWILKKEGDVYTGLSNPRAPLTTVEILVTSVQREEIIVDGNTHIIENASLPNVRVGFDRWLEEIKRNDDSVGVIYFCGHGIKGGGSDLLLLLDDHGAIINRPFETGSFNISSTIRALQRQVKSQLYIFIDACSTFSRELANRIGGTPAGALLEESESTMVVNRGMTKVVSSTDGQPAYGDSNGISRFTDAFLRAFNGFCGVVLPPGMNRWQINGFALTQAIPKLLNDINKERGGGAQACTCFISGGEDLPLHITAQVPKVKLEIALTPEALQIRSSYSIVDLGPSGAPILTGGLTAGVWQREVSRGIYSVLISSLDHQLYDSGAQHLEPPNYLLPVVVDI